MLSVALRHRFADFTLDAAFEAPDGLTALFGHSGSGKTTVVNAVAGLLRPGFARITDGDAVLTDSEGGIFLPPHRRGIGYVFQDARLFPHLTVRQNLLFGHWFTGRGRKAELSRVVDMLGIGALLSMGIGNTVRISLSADPVEEVKVARELLKSFGLITNAATLVSCPTCGRLDIDLFSIANEVEDYIAKIKVPIKVSVLGCAVNGPGEAREADIGIAGARGEGMLFRYGEMIRKVPEAELLNELKKEIDEIVRAFELTGEIPGRKHVHS